MLTEMGKQARQAAQSLARAETDQKNAALTAWRNSFWRSPP